MKKLSITRIAVALVVSAVIYGAAMILPRLIFSSLIPRLATTQGLELALSLAAIAIFGRGRFTDYGFRMPQPDRPAFAALLRWIPTGLLAIALGAAASIAVLTTGAVGNPLVRQLSPVQIVLFIWIFSSTIEEIFTRGFLQGHLQPDSAVAGGTKPPFLDSPTVISATAFACMHLVLISSGAGWKTVVIILLFTFSLGLVAGRQRSRTGSLVPAIGVHILGNVGGLVGGILYAIVSIATGHGMPTP